MISLPKCIHNQYSKYENYTKEELLQELKNDSQFVIDFFKVLPMEVEWFSIAENINLAKNIVKQLEINSKSGELSLSVAREIYQLAKKGIKGIQLESICCSFGSSKKQFFLSTLLFFPSLEPSMRRECQNIFHFSGKIPFAISQYDIVQNFNYWCETGSLYQKDLEGKQLVYFYTSQLQFALEKQASKYVEFLVDAMLKELTKLEVIEVALSIASEEWLQLASNLATEYTGGLSISFDPEKKGVIDFSNLTQLETAIVEREYELNALSKQLSTLGYSMKGVFQGELSKEEGLLLDTLSRIFYSSITELSITFSQFDKSIDYTIDGIITLLLNVERLQKLYVNGSGSRKLTEEHFEALFCKTLHLTSLSVDHCKKLSNKHLLPVIESSSKALEHIRIDQCGFIDDKVARRLLLCKKLQVFYFDSGSEEKRGDISEKMALLLFDECKQLRTMRFFNSVNAPYFLSDDPLNDDWGIIDKIYKKFPERLFNPKYTREEYS